MARLIERKFDPARPTYARKYFIASGRKYAPGDLFDWKAAMVTPRRAMQMFNAGKLTHKDDEVTPERNPLESIDHYEPEVISEEYDLDTIDDMKELRRIADEIGAPYKVSKADQRKAILDHRSAQ